MTTLTLKSYQQAALDVLRASALLVYGEACLLGEARLKQANVRFKHIPYDVRAR